MNTKMSGARTVVMAVCTVAVSAGTARAQDATSPAPPAGQQAGQQAGQPAGQQGPGGQYGHRDPAEMEARQLQMMTERLKLTPDQVTQVKAIEDSQRTQMMALRQDSSLQPEDKRTRMMAMRQDSEGKVRGVLTDEQKPKYDQMLARQRERMDHRGEGPGGPPPAAPPQ